jgi:hypothetical protein
MDNARDQFAALAMSGLISRAAGIPLNFEDIAAEAYGVADAMVLASALQPVNSGGEIPNSD